jgi:hypothetical protein
MTEELTVTTERVAALPLWVAHPERAAATRALLAADPGGAGPFAQSASGPGSPHGGQPGPNTL